MNPFWFSLLVNTSYFLADVFIKRGSMQTSTGRLIYMRSIFTVMMASVWLLLSGDLMQVPSIPDLLWFTLCSVLCTMGLFYYVRALQHLHFVNVAVIGITGAFIHYLLGVFLYNESPNPWFYLSAAISVAGILLQWKKTEQKKGLKEAVFSAVLWGFGYALLSIPMENSSPVWGTWIMESIILIISAFYLIWIDHKFSLLRPPLKNMNLLAVAVFTILGSVMINICYQRYSLNVLGFMQLAFFPYSLLAGYFLFRERLNKWEWIGNTLIFAGLAIYFYTM